MLLDRLEQLFAVTVSTPVVENVCVRQTKFMKYSPEDSYTCLQYEKRLVQHFSMMGGLFKWDVVVPTQSNTAAPDELKGFGRLR